MLSGNPRLFNCRCSSHLYYEADIAESNNIIFELVRDIGSTRFAVNSVINSDAFNYSLYKQLNTSINVFK